MSSTISESYVWALLSKVSYPGFTRDIVSFGIVKSVTVGSEVVVQLVIATNDTDVAKKLHQAVTSGLTSLQSECIVKVLVDVQEPVKATNQGVIPLPGVRHIMAVASGKGGVGKSTVAVNLAVAIAAQGLKVGLCDCDLYGPSVAFMCGVKDRPYGDENGYIIPVERHGLKIMSMGLLLEKDSPVALRGPMVTRYIQQFLRNVAWGDLDILLLDLPPGTGDIHITITQTIPMTGAVIVTTPQEVALIDARKAVAMFGKTNVPILGIIENMAYFLSPSDGVRHDIFGNGGGEAEALRLNVPFLGSIALDPIIRMASDAGIPWMLSHSEAPATAIFNDMAKKLIALYFS